MVTDTKEDFKQRIFIERAYQDRLMAISRQVEKILKVTKPELLMSRLAQYSNSLNDYASNSAKTLVYNLNKQAERQWKKQGSKINQLLISELKRKKMVELMGFHINENISLIQSIPIDTAKRAYKILMGAHVAGERFESIVPQIEKIGKINYNRATLIARTETSKISTALTQARSNVLDLKWYVWRTSEDVRVRNSHFVMSRVIVNWNEPPAPEQLKGINSKLGHYHAGNAPNCRCFPQPLVSISEDVKWPCKVYFNGKLVTMTRTQFEKIAA